MMPTKMSKKGKTFHSQARAIVNNVKICLKKKKAMKTLKFPISQATKRTTEATKITESTIKKKKKHAVEEFKKNFGDILPTPRKHCKRPESRNCQMGDPQNVGS